MNTLAPVSVALKFGFLAVMYLFLLWITRSARRDLRRGMDQFAPAHPAAAAGSIPPDATGMYSASALGSADLAHRAPRLVIERAPGHDAGMIYDLDGDIVLGRGERASRESSLARRWRPVSVPAYCSATRNIQSTSKVNSLSPMRTWSPGCRGRGVCSSSSLR